MYKKALTGTLVLIFLSTTGTVAYTIGETNANGNVTLQVQVTQSKVEVFKPENNLVTDEKVVILSGETQEGANVIVEVYSTDDLLKDNFSLENLPKKEDYTLTMTEEIEVLANGIFYKELELKLGVNKINVYLKKVSDDGKTIEKTDLITRYVQIKVSDTEKAKKAADSIGDMKFSDAMKQLMNN